MKTQPQNRSPDSVFANLRRAYAAHYAAAKGRINRNNIVEAFGVSTAQASADLNELIRQNPGMLRYCRVTRRYIWTGPDDETEKTACLPAVPRPFGPFNIP